MAENGGSMVRVPVRDQGNIGTCYAETAVSAVDAWRFSAKPPVNLDFHSSPHAAAIAERINSTPSSRATKNYLVSLKGQAGSTPINGGNENDTVIALKKHGLCSYEALGANFGKSIFQKDPHSFWTLVKNSYDLYNKQYMTALKTGSAAEQQKVLNEAREALGSQLCLANFAVPQRSIENIDEIRRFLLSEDVFEGLKNLSDKVCSGQTIQLPADFPDKPVMYSITDAPFPGAAHHPQAKSLILRRMITAMLSFQNRQPLMIAYNSSVLSSPQSSETTAKHGSLIIGRGKLTDGRCGYLIRNSWGSDGDGLGTTDRIDKNGDILVAEEDLMRSLSRISVLPPRGEKFKPPQGLYEGVDEILKTPLPNQFGPSGGSGMDPPSSRRNKPKSPNDSIEGEQTL